LEQLTLDYTNVLADAVGSEHGITSGELSGMREPTRRALAAVQARRTKDLRWLDLPYQQAVRDSILAFAGSAAGRFQTVVVLGIGGSALGNRAVHTALSSVYHDQSPPPGRPRLVVLDNIDPDWIGEFLERFDPTSCLFNVISKSGSTAETMSQFLILRRALVDRLGAARAREHIVVTTDADKGVLRLIVREEGYASFVVPDGVGGRFSVLSPVGLLSSALVGVDITELLAGAAAMDARCRADDFDRNPAQVLAAIQWLLQSKKGKPIAVTFAYSHRLRDLADWYAQLLAESLGKRLSRDGRVVHAGPTPVRAVGVTDQHSQVQLYAEGPHDKWFTFLAVEHSARDVTIPADYSDRDALAYLGSRTLGELFRAEREGTIVALTEASRPNVTLSFPRIRAHTVGQYFQLMEVAVALMGEHYGVDAFDQPGVEAGKIAAYALMGREGYGEQRARIAERQRAPRRTV
jgi:glucose-6-phosphate isomerase